ncbi:hypothetical protein [Escherichia coli]|uniref:hypothetical protein n=1 Tax=Escherichia coli TaxID=562 RepID=UPI00128ED606|nr:hypothetical protein [Escherichia coli]MQK95140.1 hypothetical protein [Escherichia coli]
MAKKKFLLLFLLCSLLPLAFAQAFLALGWFGGATTNKGQWLSEEILLYPKPLVMCIGGWSMSAIKPGYELVYFL